MPLGSQSMWRARNHNFLLTLFANAALAIALEEFGELLKLRCRGDEALARQRVEVFFYAVGRVFEARAHLGDCAAEDTRGEVELICQKFVGMLRLYADSKGSRPSTPT